MTNRRVLSATLNKTKQNRVGLGRRTLGSQSCSAPCLKGPGESWEGHLCEPRTKEEMGARGPRGGQPLILSCHHVSLRPGLCNVTTASLPPGRIIQLFSEGSRADSAFSQRAVSCELLSLHLGSDRTPQLASTHSPRPRPWSPAS